MLPRPLCPPGSSQVWAQGVRWVQDHRPAPCIDCGKGLRGVRVPVGSTGKVGASLCCPAPGMHVPCWGWPGGVLAPYAGWISTPWLGAGPVGLRSIHREGVCASPEAGREG